MNRPEPESIGARMDALGLWDALVPYNFAVKPRGTVFPYFCTVLKDDGKPVKARFLMLEGWQTLHDFVRVRMDRDFGFYSQPIEFPHFELVVLADAAGGRLAVGACAGREDPVGGLRRLPARRGRPRAAAQVRGRPRRLRARRGRAGAVGRRAAGDSRPAAAQ